MVFRHRLPRFLGAVTATLFLAVFLSACTGITIKYAPTVQPPPALGTPPAPSPAADPEAIRFAELLGKVLSAAPKKSDALNSMGLNFLFRPALPENAGTSTATTVKMRLAEPGTPSSSDITVSAEMNRNAETGSASFVAVRQDGNGSPVQAGVWFTGNTMLLKRSRDTQPRVQHTIQPQVAQSMRALPAFDRLLRILDDTGAVRPSPESWAAVIGEFQKTVAENCRAQDITSAAGSELFGSVSISTVSETLKLIGSRGVTVTRGMLALLTKDTDLRALFNTRLSTDGVSYGVTGVDGALRDIDALTDAERSAAILTIRLVETDQPVGFHLTLRAGGRTLALDLSFFDRGLISQTDFLFGGFDGSRIVITRNVTLSGTGSFSSSFAYDALSPGAQPQENIAVLTSGTLTGGTLSETSQLSLTQAASPASGAVLVGGTLSYTQKTDGASAQGNGSGTLNISSGGTAHRYNFDLTVAETSKAVPVSPPLFDSTGMSTAAQESLNKALGGFDGKAFVLAPPSTRLKAIFSLLFN